MRHHHHHDLRPQGYKPLTNPDAPHDAGRNTPAARNYRNDRRDGKPTPRRAAPDTDLHADTTGTHGRARGLLGLLDRSRAARLRKADR